jgi:anthranilate phosphoribosyltransferase
MAVALERAAAAIDSGAAADLLARWAEFSTRLAPRPA